MGDTQVSTASHFPVLLRYAIVTLVAHPTKTNHIARLARACEDILSTYFTEEMLQTGSDDELRCVIAGKRAADINHLGVALYGDVEQIDGLARGPSLWGRS
jgi:hypothetical protein